MSNFGKTERKIKDLFLSEKKFTYEQANYSVLKCDKPTSSKGECKTDDAFKNFEDEQQQQEIKNFATEYDLCHHQKRRTSGKPALL